MGYSFWLAARVLLYDPSHKQDSAYHILWYTSHGALAGTRNSLMGTPWWIDLTTHRTMSKRSYHGATSCSKRNGRRNYDDWNLGIDPSILIIPRISLFIKIFIHLSKWFWKYRQFYCCLLNSYNNQNSISDLELLSFQAKWEANLTNWTN